MKRHERKTIFPQKPSYIVSDFVIHPEGVDALHASILYQASRNTIPRHWIAHENIPLVFQCRMLEILLNNDNVLVVEAKKDVEPVYGVIECMKHRIYVFSEFDSRVTRIEVLKLHGRCEISENIEKTADIETPLLQVVLPWQPLVINSIKDSDMKQISSKEILNSLRQQYFYILYISKVSLAYFAKTTLAKARKECQEVYLHENKGYFEMMKFIETEMLRTPEELEMKFKKWLPLLVEVTLDETNDVNINEWPEEVKCWPVDADEREFILKWCNCNEDCVFRNKKNVNKRIDALKFREFELQIILVLEVLLLCYETKNYVSDQELKKSHMSINVEQYLDILVDRLCIWQALNDTDLSFDKNIDQKTNSDQLLQFCAEVVMPFYASKLPDICSGLFVKCGGPILCHHSLRSKSDKKKIQKANPSAFSKPLVTAIKSLSNVSTKSPVDITSSLATALGDEKAKLQSVSVTPRPSMDSRVKGISRDGILNSKKSLQHREIKMPLSKITKKEKLDDLTSLSNQQFVRPRVETQRIQMKQKSVTGQIQVLATPQKNRMARQTTNSMGDLAEWNEGWVMNTSINVDVNRTPLKKRQKVDVISETPIKR
ncbi:hypothetical protein PNEG_02495 [Pneumocystis murina B123]|uniref:DNA replication regulator Sld3 C-terminal domain-containing protein n=1 Tax=Pneumocystis murina (strain B123) TaxID=1069680 RepID=M7PFB6_PNEMU|nr:hypothetical protein PNEG_02495 [Pneumocystis murina B123]EMR09154.1 hypothetical protein PNEG_02495 [Pneumocystis murina B123]